MSKKIKVINNIKGILGMDLNPTNEGYRALPRQGAFLNITEDELNYIHVNQEIIQKGMLWIEDKDHRVRLGIEDEEGKRESNNILKHDEIVELVKGNHLKLRSTLKDIDEQTILTQFVEVARDLEIDSVAKIKMIEEASNMTIFDDED